jgi:predicted porin
VSDQSSSLIISASEDLGGGLRAWMQLDSRFLTDVGNSTLANNQGFATGNTGAGFAGGWGKFTIGRWDLHYNELASLGAHRAGSLQSVMSIGAIGQVNGSIIANGTRSSNVLMWDSAPMSGITARVAYSTAPFASEGSGATALTGDGSKGDALTGAVRYSAGPIGALLSYWTAKPEGAASSIAGEEQSLKAGGRFTFGDITVGLGYDKSKKRIGATGTAMVDRTGYLVPVTWTFGANQVHFNYYTIGDLSSGSNSGSTGFTLGYDMALSKRTFVGAYYSEHKNDRNSASRLFATGPIQAGEQQQQIYFGFAHSY